MLLYIQMHQLLGYLNLLSQLTSVGDISEESFLSKWDSNLTCLKAFVNVVGCFREISQYEGLPKNLLYHCCGRYYLE